VHAVVGNGQEVFQRIAGGGGLEIEHGHHLDAIASAGAGCGVAGAVVAVQQPGPQPAGVARVAPGSRPDSGALCFSLVLACSAGPGHGTG
jgi:hypothetical protein